MTPITDDEIDAIQLPQQPPRPTPGPRDLTDDMIDQIPMAPAPAADSGIQPPAPVYDIRATTRGGPPLATPDAEQVLANTQDLVDQMPRPTPVDVVSKAGQVANYAGNVLKGAAADAFNLGVTTGAGVGPRSGGNVEAALTGEPLPVDAQIQQLREEERRNKLMPWRSAGANIALGAVKTLPKIAAIAVTGGGAAAMGATRMGTLLTEMITAGGLFGVDDDGNFHPKEAAIGAAIPGVGAASRLVVAKAIGETLAKGALEPLANPTAQKVLETLGEQVGINAFTIAMDMPTLAKLYQTNPNEFQAHLTELIGGNLAFALLGVRKITDPKIPSETRDWIIRNADSLASKEILASIPPDTLRDIYNRVNAADPTATQEEKDLVVMINTQLGKPGEAIRRGVNVVTEGWPELLAKTLGVPDVRTTKVELMGEGAPQTTTGGRKRALLGLPTTGEANANRQPSTVEETGRQEAPGVQKAGKETAGVVQTPAPAGEEPGAASTVQTQTQPVASEAETIARSMGLKPGEQMGHEVGIKYGVTLTSADVPMLEAKLAKANAEILDAVRKNDGEAHKRAFGEANFWGGALMGATRGKYPGSGTNWEAYLKNNPPAKSEEPTVPELPATISAQLRMLTEGKRDAVMITEGERIPPMDERPPGSVFGTIPGVGSFIWNPEKLNPQKISDAVKKDRLGDILGYGIPRKPAKGTEIGAVVVRGPDGVEKWGVLTDKEHLASVMEHAKKVAGPDDTIKLEPESEVIAKRNPANAKPSDVLPPVPAGFVRMYHGGSDPTGDLNGARDISPYYEYAKGYAAKSGSPVWYVDVPENAPYMKKAFEEFEGGPKSPFINTKAPADVMRGAKKVTGAKPAARKAGDLDGLSEAELDALLDEAAKPPEPAKPPVLKASKARASRVARLRSILDRLETRMDRVREKMDATEDSDKSDALGKLLLRLETKQREFTKDLEIAELAAVGRADEPYMLGGKPLGISKAQYREMTKLNDYQQVAKWGYSIPMLIEKLTTGVMPAPRTPPKPTPPTPPKAKGARKPALPRKTLTQRPADRIERKLIGKNSKGQDLYEDNNGVRYLLEGNIWIGEAVQLRPTREGGYETSVGDRTGGLYEKADEGKPAEKTASDIAADAAKAGVKGVDEAIKGLHKLFGGGTHLGTGPSFDEKTYAEAKPHFESAWEQFRKAGKSLAEFLRFILEKFGAGARAYIKRFIQEKQAEAKEEKSGLVPTKTDKPEPVTRAGIKAIMDEAVARHPKLFEEHPPHVVPAGLATDSHYGIIGYNLEGLEKFARFNAAHGADAMQHVRLSIDEELTHVRDIIASREGGKMSRDHGDRVHVELFQDVPTAVREAVKALYPKESPKDLMFEILRMKDQLDRLGNVTESALGGFVETGQMKHVQVIADWQPTGKVLEHLAKMRSIENLQPESRDEILLPVDVNKPAESPGSGISPGGKPAPRPSGTGPAETTSPPPARPGEQVQPPVGEGNAGQTGGAVAGSDGTPVPNANGIPEESGPAPANPAPKPASGGTVEGVPGKPAEPAAPAGASPEPAAPELKNLRLTESPAPTGPVARVSANIRAIEIVKRLEKEQKPPTEEDRKELAAWSGWGSFKELFNEGRAEKREYDPGWAKRYGKAFDRLKALLTEKEFNAAAESSVNAHYTSPEAIKAMWSLTKRLGFRGGRVLESAVGRGDFIGFTPSDIYRKIGWTAVELDPITAKIASYLYPEADLRAQGFEDAKLPRGYYDLNITNVPFHEVGPGKEYPTMNLHNYFIARGLDMLKPGGLLVVISTKGTMDLRPDQRKILADKGQLIGAIRLPNNAFKESAATEVVTDIIVLRKPDGKPFDFSQPWTNTGTLEEGGQQFVVNEYFVAHPDMILGKNALTGTMYQKNEYTVEGTGPLEPKLLAAIEKFPQNISFQQPPKTLDAIEPSMTTMEDFTLSLNEKNQVVEARNFQLERPSWDTGNPTLTKRAREYVKLRNALMDQYSLERNPASADADIEANRKKLRTSYDAWVKSNGTLNQNDRKTSYLSSDPGYYTVMGMENVSEEIDPNDAAKTITIIRPADIMTKRMIMPDVPPAKSESAADALGVSMSYKGELDMDYIRELTGLTDEQIEAELIASNLGFKDPESGRLLTTAEYLTGEVRDKLAKAMFAAKDNSLFSRNVEALQAVIPETVPFDRISADITARWTPVTILNKFAVQVIGLADNLISIVPVVDEFAVKEPRSLSDLARSQWSTKAMEAPSLLQHALNFKRALVQVWDASAEKYVKDVDGTALANTMIDKIKAEYATWIRKTNESVPYKFFDAKRGEYRTEALPIWDVMEREFNRVANSFVVPDHDGTNLKLPHLSQAVRRTQHLLNGVQRAINAGAAVFAHGVGSGKTFLGVVLGHELQRIGLSKKFVHVIKKPTVDQYRVSIQRAYPGSRVLIPSKKDFEPANRKKLIARIAATKWDFIILTHEQFKSISPGSEMVSQFFEEQLEQLRQILRDRGNYSPDMEKEKFSTRGLPPEVRNLVRKLKTLRKRMTAHLDSISKRQDKGSNWENLGIDGLFIDESHNFKKMPLATNMEGEVKGIPSDFSQRAVDLLIKVRDIQQKTEGRNIFFASGTPVSNTLAELWIQFNATAPKLLKEFHIETFDAFASTYADVITSFEMAWDNSFRDVTRMARFKNPAGLTTLTRMGMDVKIGNKELGIDVPDVEGGKPAIHVIKSTKSFERWIELLDAISEAWETLDPKGRFENSWVPIATMRAGVAAALDPRCVFHDAPDEPGSKVNTAVNHIVDEWFRGQANRTTMMVFADMYRTLNTEKLLSFLGSAAPPPPELEIPPETAADDTGDTGAADEAAFEKMAVGEFNLYNDIRRKLVARGIPEHEIGIITEHDTDAKRDALFNKVRNGLVRILIGSTEKIGEGVDVPQRMSAQFHLDPPMAMTPAKMEQRIGRIIRQGNMFSVKNLNMPVRLNLYAQEKSMDAAIYQLLETKGTMILQALRGQFLGDTFEDPASELTLAMAEMKAAATGDTRVIELAKMIKEVRDLSVAEGAFYRRVSELRRLVDEESRAAKSDAHGAAQDKRISEVTASIVAEPEKMSMLHVRTQTRVTGEEAIKEWLKKARAAADAKPDAETMASLIFNDKLRVSYEAKHKVWYAGKISHSATFWIGGPDPLWSDARYDSDISSIESVLAVLKGIPERAAKKSELETASAAKHDQLSQAYAEQLGSMKFNEEAELQAKKQALKHLEGELRSEKAAKKDARVKAREAKKELDVPPDAQAEVSNETESADLAVDAKELKAQGLEELRELLNHPKAGLSGDVVRVALDLLDQPVMKNLDWDRLRVDLKNRIAGNVAGSSRVSRWLIEMTRAARPTTLPHEVFHFLYEMLPDAERDRIDQLRREALTSELRQWGDAMPAEVRSAIEQMQTPDGMSSRDFLKLFNSLKDENQQSAEWLLSIYHLTRPSEYLAGIGARKFSDDSFSKKNQGWLRKLFERLKGWLQAILDAFKRLRGVPPDIRQIIRELLAGRYRNNPEDGAKAEAWAEEQHSIEEDEATGIPTRVFGEEDFVRDREQITPSSSQASVDYAKTIFDAAKVPVSLDSAGLWRIDNPGFDLNAEGRRLLQLLRKEIAAKNEPGKAGDLLASLLNAIVYNFKLGTMDVFDRPLRQDLYSAAQADRSQRGLQLGALAMHLPDLQFASQNLDVTLSRIWSDAYGGEEIRSIVMRVLDHFRDWFSDEEINRALASKPELAELVEKIIAMNRRDEGGRVYRRAQAMLKPKMKKTLERMEGDARVDEAVAHIIETAKRLGIEPKPNPNKKLSPLQSLLVMVTPETAEKIDAAVAKAVQDAERNAGIKAQIKAAANEAEREDWRGRFDAGEEPDPDMIEEGLNLPEFNHWKWLRESLLAYSPTTVKLARDLVRADFKGTRFGKDVARPADTRLDLEKMAKQPDAEIDRGLDAYLQNLEANMDLPDATQETKDRVTAMIEGQIREQVEKMRERIRNVLFKEPPAPGTKLTAAQQAEQQMAQLVNAKLFADPRLDIPEMVARVAGKSKVRRLAPNITDLVKDVLATPFYRQDELGKMFADNLIGQMSVPQDQADHARAVFEEAFRQPFEKARAKALEQAKAALTPQERRKIKPGAALWLKIERMVNAGGFDSADIIQDIARAKGWTIPTEQQVRHMRNLAEAEMRLRELTPQEKAVVGDDPRAIERALADRSAATLEKRAALVKQMGTIWARFTRPISARHLWATRKNIAAAANEFEVANMLLKIGFGFRLPTHILTQLLVHIPTRAIGDAILAHKDELARGNPSSVWKVASRSLADAYSAALKGLRPALQSAHAALAGRGEARNVDRLMSGIHLFERMDDKAKEFAAQGDHVRSSMLRIMGLAKFALRFVQGVDNFQGVPAEYAAMVEQVRNGLREQGRSPAEITASLDRIFGSMKLKRDAALAKAREILNASNQTAGEKELRETAWNIVRARIYEDMRDIGLPADSFREMNEKLRRTIAWQERVTHGPGGLVATVGRGFSSLLQEAGLPMSFTRFANAIGTGINYMLMFTPAYALANARIPGITRNEDSPWFETEQDVMQRRVQAILGSILGALMMALVFSGAVVVRLFWPKDKEERDLWEAQGHRPGTIEFRINDHEFIPISMTVGPGSLVAPYAAAAGSVMDMLDQRQKAQAKLTMEAQKRGLQPGKVRPLDASDWLTVAAQSAWATLMGNKALSGVAQSMTEFGIPNSKKTMAAYVSPLVLGLPQYQEITRMMGVQMDSKIASFWDYLVPLPTSGARAVNMLGEPVGTPDAVQRVFQNVFAGTYPWVVDENAVRSQAPYAALFGSGYRPPSIDAGKGHAINGEWRPLTDEELMSYTVARGRNMAREFGDLGPTADMQSMKGAYQRANDEALSSIGVDTTVKPIGTSPGATPGVVQATGGQGRVSPYASVRRAVGLSGRVGGIRGVSGVRIGTGGAGTVAGGLRRPGLRSVGKPRSGLRGPSLKGGSDLKKRPASRKRGLHG